MARTKQSNVALFKPFNRGANSQRQPNDLREHVDGPGLLGELHRHLTAIEAIDTELANSVQDHERNIMGPDGNVIRV